MSEALGKEKFWPMLSKKILKKSSTVESRTLIVNTIYLKNNNNKNYADRISV